MQLTLQPEQIAYPQGLTITVPGFNGDTDHEVPSQVFLEVRDGVLCVYVWNGEELEWQRFQFCTPAKRGA